MDKQLAFTKHFNDLVRYAKDSGNIVEIQDYQKFLVHGFGKSGYVEVDLEAHTITGRYDTTVTVFDDYDSLYDELIRVVGLMIRKVMSYCQNMMN